jgi:hypothetical protein
MIALVKYTSALGAEGPGTKLPMYTTKHSAPKIMVLFAPRRRVIKGATIMDGATVQYKMHSDTKPRQPGRMVVT